VRALVDDVVGGWTSKRIFVSYTGVDSPRATFIAATLRSAGHHVTIQDWDFLPGRNLVLEMQEALKLADHTIAVLSPEYEASAFASAEWAAAFYSDPTGLGRKLIGVRVAAYRPTGLLAAIVYIDLVGVDDATAARHLLDGIESPGGLTASAPSPSRPPLRRARQQRIPENFGGRVRELEALDVVFEAEERAVVAVTGFGGLGKSTLSAAWAARRRDRYAIAIWAAASDGGRARLDMHRAAVDLGVASASSELDQAVSLLVEHLAEINNWLVVFDDCHDAALIPELLPLDRGHILVTSRNDRGWTSRGYKQLRLQPWTVLEAAEYLLRAAPDAGDEAAGVAEALGGLPLAIAQAAAYVDSHGLTFAAYLDRLVSYAPRVFQEPLGPEYSETVMSVWAIALETLEVEHPAAHQLLDVLSAVGSEDFPRSLFTLGAAELEEPLSGAATDLFDMDEAVSALLRQSLCSADGDGLSVHPVVQGVVWARMSSAAQMAALRSAVKLLEKAQPPDTEATTWPVWERLGNHITVTAAHAILADTYIQELNDLVTQFADFLRRSGQPHLGSALLGQHMAYQLKHVREAQPDDVATAISNAAYSLVGLRAADAAVDLFRRALSIDELTGSVASPRSVGSRIGLASALTDTQQHDEALAQLAIAGELLAAAEDAERELLINLHGTWGRVLLHSGDVALARSHLLQALETSRSAGMREREALTLVHLGNADRADGDTQGAGARYATALVVAAQLDGCEQLRAEIHGSLAGIAGQTGDVDGLREHVDAGLKVLAAIPEGMSTISAAQLLYNGAQLFRSTGDQSHAREYAEQALVIVDIHLNARHPFHKMVSRLLSELDDS
jgi:tetratricopeptide (TPR) repeat protein